MAALSAVPAEAQTIAGSNSHVREQDIGIAGRSASAPREGGIAAQDGESEAAAGMPPAIPGGDPSLDPEEQDPSGLDPRPLSGQRAVVQDGDLSYPAEPTQPYDGIAGIGEPVAPPDGTDPSVIDTRDRQDINLFEQPAAGYDPLLFQIEDIDPITTDRRPRRLAAFEPYDPVGIKLGSFVYFPELEVSGVATNNVLRAPSASPDVYAEVRSQSRLVSNWEAHALELRSTGTYNFHDAFPSEDDRAWGVEGRGRLDVTKRTNVQALLSHDVRQEGRSAIDATTTGERPDVTTGQAQATLNHRFNRLSLQLRGSHTETDYSDVLSGAAIQNNDDRDAAADEEAVRAKWELKPAFSVYAEAEMNQREFDAPAQSDGIRRDSSGERYRFGVDFGSAGKIVRGEVSLGWGRQSPDDARLDDVTAFLVDSNVAWRVTELTSLTFNAGTEIYDTTTAGSAGVVSHSAGVELRHAFREYLIGTAGLALSARDYASLPLEETELTAALGAEYFVNREIILFSRYQHIAFDSNAAASDWHSDDVRVGVRYRR